MTKKDFSKKILKYTLKNGISESDLNNNYRNLIHNYYEYGNHVFYQRELVDYLYDYRTELFYKEKKATFWLLLDYTLQERLGSIPKEKNEPSETVDDQISKNSELNEIYLFLKKRLYGLEEEFYNKIIKKSLNLFLKKDERFVKSMWSQFSEYLNIDQETSENIVDKLEDFYLFQDAFEDYCEENDIEY